MDKRICWNCNESYEYFYRERSKRALCETCSEKHEKDHKELLENYATLKMRVMADRALRRIEYQKKINIEEYREPYEVVLEMALKNHNKFQSSHEMIATMELLRNRVHTKLQYPVGRKKVDMLLPTMKVALEIDGKLHDFKTLKDSKRDTEILNELNQDGSNWEIVRIPTKYLEQNVSQLIPAIKAIYAEKQRLRRKHGGFLPTYFSKGNSENHIDLLKGVKDDTKTGIKERIEDLVVEEL